MLQRLRSTHFRAYIIWQPVLRSDDRKSARRRTLEFANERFVHFWDKTRLTGELWQRVLDRKSEPWDVYLLYEADAQWERTPTKPDYWVWQLNNTTKKGFELKARRMLAQIQ